ncbi:MAG: PAS domain-containing protein [Lachnospiraceae bacterium]|nr:PAS domain-containing protein [Lachnospiraceae bacterium]
MNTWISIVLLIIGVINMSVGATSLADDKENHINRIFFGMCITSMVWCMGYAFMYMAHSDMYAYIFRAIALLGVFVCCFFIMVFVQVISGVKFRYQKAFNAYMISIGIMSLILIAMPQSVTFVKTAYGRSYMSNPWIGRYVQLFYLGTLFLACFYMGIRLRQKAGYTRERMIARTIIITSCIIVLGTVFDVGIPMLGGHAFPSSAISTLLFTQVYYRMLKQYNSTVLATSGSSKYIFRTIANPVLILNEKLCIMDFNDNACTYLAISADKLKGAYVNDYVTYLNDGGAEQIYTDIYNLSERIEVGAKIKKTGFICDMVMSPVFDAYNDPLCLICIINDKTGIEQLKSEALYHAHRSEVFSHAKKSFLCRIREDMRGPILDTVSYLNSVKADMLAGGNADRSNEAEAIRQKNIHLLDTLDELLDIARIESDDFTIQLRPFDLEDLILEVISDMSDRIGDGRQTLLTGISPLIPRRVIGDGVRLKQIMTIIMSNAIRYTPEGYITLTLKSVIEFGEVTLHFTVSDTGRGMRAQDMDHIFGIEGDEDGSGGSSLSLSLCAQLVKMMGGEIKLQSTLGSGTTFFFSVKLRADSEEAIVPYGDYDLNALIITDDVRKAQAMENVLKELGLRCETMVKDKVESMNFVADDEVDIVFVAEDILNRMRAYLNHSYRRAKLIPVYSYKEYKRLDPGSEGICGALLFSQIGDILKETQ